MKILNLKGIGALPVGFKGKINGKAFSIRVQYDAFGGVKAQIFDESGSGGIVTTIMGAKGESESKGAAFAQWAIQGTELANKVGKAWDRDKTEIKKKATAFVKQLSGEVSDFNKGKDQRIKKVKTVTIAPAPAKVSKPAARKKAVAKKPAAKTTARTKQTGGSNLKLDKMKSAQSPGKRPAGPGAQRPYYYEYRRNRSDKPGSKI